METNLYEISKTVAGLWMIGSAILWAGISYGVIKVTQRTFSEKMEKMTEGLKCLEHRLTADEHNYVKVDTCRQDQKRCGQNRDYHESQVCRKIEEIKSQLLDMDRRRSETRAELSEKLTEISEEIIKLKTRIGEP